MHNAFSLRIFGLPLLAGIVCAFFGPSSDRMEHSFRPNWATATAFSLLTVVSWLFMNSNISQQFVYFRF